MALCYDITPSGNQVRILGTGALTTAEFIAMIERLCSDPRCRSDSTALVDLRNASYKPEDDAEIIDIARALGAFRSVLKSNIAIVTKQSTLFLAELFSLHVRDSTNAEVRVFADISAAEAFCRGR